MKIAKRMDQLESSGIRKMFELAAKMKNPIDLSLGQPNFDVPEPVKNAAIAAIKEGKNRYTMSAGIPELKSEIISALDREGVTTEHVMAVAGASAGLLLALMATCDEGDEVLVPDPGFVSYGHLIRVAGGIPKKVNTYPHFKMTPESLRAAVTEKTKFLIHNSPNNPTGIAYSAEETKALALTAKELDLIVISDEVYDQFCYDIDHECWLKYDPDAILVRAFSKSWGMPGWRSGFVSAPQEIIEQMTNLQQFTYVCVHTPTQWASIEALRTSVTHIVDEYRKKRDLTVEILRKSFEVEKPGGAFYIFPKAPNGDTDTFLQRCIKEEILIVPGKAFSNFNTHFRVSYATDDTTLRAGLEKLCQIADSLN